METNKHIVENLDNYLNLISPEYAFLLCGEWGVGKTYFIDKYIESRVEQFKLIKVSLFGSKSISDINANIFQKLHPILGSKGARLAGNFIKGAFSMGVKVDINSDGASESTINTKLDKIEFFDFFSNKKSKEIILVFDDIERSQISILDVLGFINELVENSQVKVILIANESELIKSCNSSVYKDFKEKVIGKTFEIKHDFNSVLCDFLEGHSLNDYKDTIQEIYNKSKFKNLRRFKQSIDDFNYLVNNIDDKYKDNAEFYRDLVRCFFALNIEVKKGSLSEEDLRKNKPFMNGYEENINNYIYKNYFSEQARLYDGDTWANIIFKGYLNGINEETSKLALFIEKKQGEEEEKPAWLKLWDYKQLEEDEFLILINQVESELESLSEHNLRIYLHKIALVTYFGKLGLGGFSVNKIMNIVKSYICKYKNSEHWRDELVSGSIYSNSTGYLYCDGQDKDFSIFLDMIVSENKNSYIQGELIRKECEAKKIVDSILNSMDSNLDNDFRNLLLNVYQQRSILNLVEPKIFVNSLTKANNKIISKIECVVNDRYSENYSINNMPRYYFLKDELDFWKGVDAELHQVMPDITGLKKHLLNLFLERSVLKIIDVLSFK
ncbi:P-loop NTPase fold protein [Shewanella baltica]|uniref:P-loop NTPase fold protein n=1 Tax=Shewanella baltica TaxID=62322 RepID=UPI00287160D6|nr:P-loop NTPase fold protein [Shewanella baltica]MDR9766650.1 P-loop NTPase fold protein [Shewanella baltica]